ncbi:MAG: hypothetical protein R3C25_13130 [Hyphomonadaceae bacterium]
MSVAKKKSAPRRPAKGAKKRPGPALNDALAEAAWAEADAAFAAALAEFDALSGAKGAARAAAMDIMAQKLSQAARRRGLSRIGVVGAEEAFDPTRHDLDAGVSKLPEKVRIEARGVARGDNILVKPRVAPVRKPRQ